MRKTTFGHEFVITSAWFCCCCLVIFVVQRLCTSVSIGFCVHSRVRVTHSQWCCVVVFDEFFFLLVWLLLEMIKHKSKQSSYNNKSKNQQALDKQDKKSVLHKKPLPQSSEHLKPSGMKKLASGVPNQKSKKRKHQNISKQNKISHYLHSEKYEQKKTIINETWPKKTTRK